MRNNSIKRSSSKPKKLFFIKKKKIISENFFSFKKKYKVRRIIRFLKTDFTLIKKKMNRLTHFSIQETAHKKGELCLIVKIHKKGFYNGKKINHPMLSYDNFIYAKCIKVKNRIKYSDLKKNNFKYSLKNIKNVISLKKSILRRYKKSLSHLTDSKKLLLGIAITELKILKNKHI